MEIAWAAGFFDGEGSTYANRNTPRVAIGHVDRRPLDRFLAAVGVGSVTGPYDHNTKKNPKWRPHYTYQAYGDKAIKVLDALWPYLSAPKREQAERVLARTGRMSSSTAKE